ncbi:potassium-transporting ATPase subunit KdpA [soil metagenome]
MTWHLALNTAISFSTTTTWQAYAGESTMSYFSQMAGLLVQNFLAGAAGLAVGVAFIRGFARRRATGLGNFWVDLTRSLLWILLPIAFVSTLVLVWRGVPLNFNDYTTVQTIAGGEQTIPQGPVAALEVIKNLGTNGGGFFNANGAHPFENPTPFTAFFEMLLIVAIPAGLTYTFGRMVGNQRQGWLLYAVMIVLFSVGLFANDWAESNGNPALASAGVDQSAGNMEGKETRFGIGSTVLTAIVTSNTSTGSYNAMHDSFSAIGGMVPMVNMMLGEIVFGGLGGGLYGLIMVALFGLFLSGLMVGRTPSFLGKRVGPRETRLIVLYALLGPIAILLPSAIALVTNDGLAGLTTNSGAHGLSEIVYAFSSSTANNGQNFAGLSANSVFYNLATAFSMLIGRFGLALAALALAGLVAAQQRRPTTAGTLPTDTPLFGGIVIGTAIIVGALTYLPVLALGPIYEHFAT